MSASQVVECFEFTGRRVGRVQVSSFHVNPGEIIKVEFAAAHSIEMHEVEDLALKEFQSYGRVTGVVLTMNRTGLREFFHRQTAAEVLVDRYGMTNSDAMTRLRAVGVNPNAQLAMLAGNPRWMIGFIGAMSQRPDVLVFTTTGCDATGMKHGLAAVSEQLGNTAAVYLSCFNDLNIVEPEYAAVIQAVPIEEVAAA